MTVWTPPTNAIRAEWGEASVKADPDYGQNDLDSTVGDVLANIMHYADREGLNFDECLRMAYLHHADEVTEEES